MQSFLITILRLYRYFFGFSGLGCCRFYPTCSEYALRAIKTKGSSRGLWLVLCRFCRCHPFNPGGYDPVP